MNSEDIWIIVVFVLIIGLAIGLVVYGLNQASECEKLGGQYIRTYSGYACVKVEKLK